MLRGCRRVHIGQTVPRLLFIKCLNPPSQPDNTSVQIQRDQGLAQLSVTSKGDKGCNPSIIFHRLFCLSHLA